MEGIGRNRNQEGRVMTKKDPKDLQTDLKGFLAHMADRKEAWPGTPVDTKVFPPGAILKALQRAGEAVQDRSYWGQCAEEDEKD